MARRMFAVVDVVELLRHWQAGDNVSQMARALGLDRKTVRKYVGRAEAAGMAPGGAPLSEAEWAAKVSAWFPELTDPRARSSAFGQIAPFHEYIEKHLGETTLATIHQRLRDEHGLTVSVASLRRYVRSELPEVGAEERSTVLRDDPPPGQEAQLDYGHLGSWLDPQSGARRRVWAFIMVLAFSRHLFCYPVLRMTQPEFLAAHVAAYPYLLRGMDVTAAGQVWCADITYLPMARGFCYLVAIMDWASRRVLSFRLSNTLDASFCIEALEEALQRYQAPEIFNTDQGSQFTSEGFTGTLLSRGVAISMDGRGRWMDNVFIERLWRSVKYEEVYLKGYENIPEARRELTAYFDFYNHRRRHQGLADRTPDEVYWSTLQTQQPEQTAA